MCVLFIFLYSLLNQYLKPAKARGGADTFFWVSLAHRKFSAPWPIGTEWDSGRAQTSLYSLKTRVFFSMWTMYSVCLIHKYVECLSKF